MPAFLSRALLSFELRGERFVDGRVCFFDRSFLDRFFWLRWLFSTREVLLFVDSAEQDTTVEPESSTANTIARRLTVSSCFSSCV
ncbi:MAG: hypothetical protein MJE77_47390 [Proteobacteria bacterium]|nr:hypothetical protein [Pseudomonadota bacterium]